MNIKKVAADPLQLLFVLYLAIPLIYVPGNFELLSAFRYWFFVLIPIIALSFRQSRIKIFKITKAWPTSQRLMALAVILLMIITTTFMLFSQKLLFFGFKPYYLGLSSWIIFLIIALIFQGNVKRQIFKNYSLYIFGIAMLVSIGYNINYIVEGIRLQGVMFQPTSLSIYANLAVIVALQNTSGSEQRDRGIAWLVLVLSAVVVLLTQSRIGVYLLVLNLVLWALKSLWQKKFKAFAILVLGIVLILVGPVFYSSKFERFQTGEVNFGVSYRLSLYNLGLRDVIQNNLLIGNGPSSRPSGINNINRASGDVRKTLQQGYVFTSSHNLYIDFAYYFGFTSALALVAFTIWSIYNYLKRYNGKDKLPYIMLFLALLANAIFNTPSLELTSLFFVVLLGLTYQTQHINNPQLKHASVDNTS